MNVMIVCGFGWITNRILGVVSPRSMCVNELKLRSMDTEMGVWLRGEAMNEWEEIVFVWDWRRCHLEVMWSCLMTDSFNQMSVSKSENVKMGKEYKLMRRGLESNAPLEI